MNQNYNMSAGAYNTWLLKLHTRVNQMHESFCRIQESRNDNMYIKSLTGEPIGRKVYKYKKNG